MGVPTALIGRALRLAVPFVLLALALAACGSSGSAPSAEDAARLVEGSQHIGLVRCEKQEGGDRVFACTGLSGKEEVKLQATVSESGDEVTVVRCPGSTSSNTSGCEGRR